MNAELIGAAVARGWAAVCLAVSVVAVTAQETNEQVRIDFRNKIPGIVDAPVVDRDGITRLEGSSWMTELYAGPASNSLLPVVHSTFRFLTGADAGYWDYTTGKEVIIWFHPNLGQRIWFQVSVYELVNVFPFPEPIHVGASPVYSMVVTNYVMPMVGLESFTLEPERLEITRQADQTIVRWQYLAASRYELQSTSDLRPPVSWAPIFEWSGLGENWQIFSITNAVTALPQFYRLERWGQSWE